MKVRSHESLNSLHNTENMDAVAPLQLIADGTIFVHFIIIIITLNSLIVLTLQIMYTFIKYYIIPICLCSLLLIVSITYISS